MASLFLNDLLHLFVILSGSFGKLDFYIANMSKLSSFLRKVKFILPLLFLLSSKVLFGLIDYFLH